MHASAVVRQPLGAPPPHLRVIESPRRPADDAPPLDWALFYAAHDIAVFQIVPRTKRPAEDGWQDKATTDSDTIRRLWSGKRRDFGIGAPTGPLLAIDLDDKVKRLKAKGLPMVRCCGHDTLAQMEDKHGTLPETWADATPSGGEHLIFRSDEPAIHNSAGRIGADLYGPDDRDAAGNLLFPGIDVRATGGFIVLPPSIGANGKRYCWKPGQAPGEIELEDAPAWLIAAALPPPRPKAEPGAYRPRGDDLADRWASAALDDECRALAGCRDARNQACNEAAFRLGRIVGGGYLDRGAARSALIEAMMANGDYQDDPAKAEDTIDRALDTGAKVPRHPIERQRHARSQGNGRDPDDADAWPHGGARKPGEDAKADGPPRHDAPRDDGPRRRFPLVPFAEIRPTTTPAHLVRGIIPRDGLVVIWGPPKCGKSFWTFDLVMHISLSRAYRGRRTQAGIGVYVACEGEGGLSARAEAYRQRHSTEGARFYLLTTKLDLIKDAVALVGEIEQQVPGGRIDAIVLDTLNRSLVGSEIDDMGDYVRAADHVRAAFHCAVLIVHHCGVEEKRPRGHTSLTGAADAQIAIKKDDATRIVTATVEYMKDGESDAVVANRLEPIEVGTDDNGDPITSCVLTPVDDVPKPDGKRPKVSGKAAVALRILRNAIAGSDEKTPAGGGFPTKPRPCVSTDLWRKLCERDRLAESDDAKSQHRAFKRARDDLRGAEIINISQDKVWLA